jgi:hypothetical protein
MPVYPGAPHRSKPPTRLRSPKQAPVPDQPNLGPGPDRTSQTQFHASKAEATARRGCGADFSPRERGVCREVCGQTRCRHPAPQACRFSIVADTRRPALVSAQREHTASKRRRVAGDPDMRFEWLTIRNCPRCVVAHRLTVKQSPSGGRGAVTPIDWPRNLA